MAFDHGCGLGWLFLDCFLSKTQEVMDVVVVQSFFVVWISQVRREQHVQTLQVWLELLKIGWWPCWLVVVVFQLQEWSLVLVVLKDIQSDVFDGIGS